MEFEIYLPCNPEWVCDILLYGFAGVFGLVILVVVAYIIREYRVIHRVRVVRRRKRTRRK
ncbi:hypothetical protein [Vibrio paucivorans]|uniref:Uncharacterized protein n=1 Tax=Vibrio paucivorans TaxID=2829489 RepID=A0A9X3CBC2_9VIBR|nr:hypothetical protein [Vibrio paucivorans]MCW8332541.1 hypothetical protein [Vibrio paucivorans]